MPSDLLGVFETYIENPKKLPILDSPVTVLNKLFTIIGNYKESVKNYISKISSFLNK